MADETQYWFNTRTGQVDQGHQAGAADLMGPYATRAEAEEAPARARARTEAWDAAEAAEDDA